MKYQCPKLKKVEKDKTQSKDDENAAAAVSSDVVILSVEECLHVSSSSIEWVVDSGASYHATPRKEYFSSYKEGDFGTVKMGNSSHS